MIGIIGAMDIEIATLKENMSQITVERKAGMEFYKGRLSGKDVVVVQCGVGKVNAAICTQALCSNFSVSCVINTGVAGSLCSELDIGDLVVSSDAMHHDMNCISLRYPVGQVPGMKVHAFPADKTMIECAYAAAEAVNPGHTRIGRVASGDQFVCHKEQKEKIIAETGGICAEMEGAAIAHAAYRNEIPFVIIRAISDKADDSAQMDYPVFEKIAAARCAQVTMDLVKRLS